MLEKIKQIFNYWANTVAQFGNERRYFLAILTFLPPIVLVALLAVLIIKVITACFNFFHRYYVELIIATIAICVLIAWCDKRRAEKFRQKQAEREQEEHDRYMARKEYAATKDATYIEQGKMLFDVAREASGLGLIPPMRLSNLYSPSRTIPKLNGEVTLCQYLLEKDREVVDVELVKQTLQTKVNQRLMAGEFPGIPETHTYRGRTYSGFVIDAVRDGEGYLEVYTALANDAYCRYKERRELNSDRLAPPVDRRDVDY